MNRKGDKIMSIYWFAILFIVTGAIVYMAGVFYGAPYDATRIEERILTNKIADCMAKGGKLRHDVFTDEFKNDFLKKCRINLTTKESRIKEEQYYVEINFFGFSEEERLKNHDIKRGNDNLKLKLIAENVAVTEKTFYALKKETEERYFVKITAIVGKADKNRR